MDPMTLDPTAVLGLTGVGMLVSAALVLRLPVGRCDQCPHCQDEARREAQEQVRLEREVEQRWGLPRRCPRCGGYHEQDEGP